jgi:KUP system potassium uptake protein
LGVVCGGIGTSSVYAIQAVFAPSDPHPVPVSTERFFGVVSLIAWSAMVIVTITYVSLVMCADKLGEGSIMG